MFSILFFHILCRVLNYLSRICERSLESVFVIFIFLFLYLSLATVENEKKQFFFLSIMPKRRKLTEEHVHNYRTEQKVNVDTPLYEYDEIDHINELLLKSEFWRR